MEHPKSNILPVTGLHVVQTRLTPTQVERLRRFCEATDRSMASTLRYALLRLLEQWEAAVVLDEVTR